MSSVDIDQKSVGEQLVSADYINMSGLLELCCDFQKSMFEHGNCIDIMRFAKGSLVLSQL
jgi:hypothetical protein